MSWELEVWFWYIALIATMFLAIGPLGVPVGVAMALTAFATSTKVR